LASALDTVLSGLPFVTRQWFACKPREGTVTEKLDAGAVDQVVWRPIGAPIRDLDSQALLPPTQGRMIRHGPVQVRHPRQASHHPRGLPQRQFEQHLDGQTELDRGIREHGRVAAAAIMRREPRHILIQPDQQ